MRAEVAAIVVVIEPLCSTGEGAIIKPGHLGAHDDIKASPSDRSATTSPSSTRQPSLPV